ncbi:YncE family protein [Kushneria aurantia]|uniref:YncE family protein n=1 Tax=Kushneria aurantia TaxID=504092 RepID=A0ABV6G1R5_9GAMM|nr:YncE family protein [Kushneria aurantia]
MTRTLSYAPRFVHRTLLALALAALMASPLQAAEEGDSTAQPAPDRESVDARVEPAVGLYELAFSPSQEAIYVAAANGFKNEAGGTIYRLDPQTLEIEGQIDLEQKAFGLALNPRTHTLFVGHALDQSISAVSLESGEVRHLALVSEEEKARAEEQDLYGPNPRQLRVDASTNTLYVTGVATHSVLWIIDGESLTLENTVEGLGEWTTGLALDPDAGRVYVSTIKAGEVIAIDMQSHQIMARWPSGGDWPTNLALDSDRQRLYVTNQKSANVAVLDTRSGEIVAILDSAEGALDLLLDGNRLWVTNRDASSVTLFDTQSDERTASFVIDPMPNSLLKVPNEAGVYLSLKQPLDDELKAPGPDAVIHLVP